MAKPRIHPVIKSPHAVSLQIEEINPERAFELLSANTNNRKLREREIKKYARDMRDGKWRPGAGESVHVDPMTGEIGNGQHRLYAIIEADVTVGLPVLYAPISYRQVADQGIRRKFSDVLKIEYEEENVNTLAAAVRLLWEYRESGMLGAKTEVPSTSELIDVYLAETDVKNSVVRGKRTNDGAGIRPGLAVVLHYLFSQVSTVDADRFFDRLNDGIGLAANDPVLAVRKSFLSRTGPRDIKTQAAYLIKAFNYTRQGRRLGKMYTPDVFPTIKG